jgi:uncharacterized repeat protein (TIGR03803 family)
MKRFRVVCVSAWFLSACGGNPGFTDEVEGRISQPQIFTPRPNVGVNFVGGGPNGNPQPMASTELAGLVPYTNWSNAAGATGSQIVPTSDGFASLINVQWSSNATFSTGIADAPGNSRLMKGFLNTSNTSTTTVSFTNLPASGNPGEFGYATADVLVYFDGSNLSADRTGVYNITSGSVPSRTLSGKDAAGVQFSGTFVPVTVNGATGNVIKFTKVPLSTDLTITATPGASGDASKRAPVNAVQIVPDFEGIRPTASLVQASNGVLWGVASQGGAFGNGTVFNVTTTGVFNVVHTFTETGLSPVHEGVHPETRLDVGPDGNFYGTTTNGGASGSFGVVFRMTPAGAITVLHDFVDGTDGAFPTGRLVVGGDGALYGTTKGLSTAGTVYRITRDGSSFTTLHAFPSDGSEGRTPDGGLKFLGGVNFMGVTAAGGGTDGAGTVFGITQSGVFTTLHQFTSSGGSSPNQKLTLGADGKLYGSTQFGNGAGTVFTITPSGTFATIFSFPSDGTRGDRPSGEILRASDNSLWGVTEFGGANNGGTVFKIVNGVTTAPFVSLPAGFNPLAGLVQGTDGNFYGTATDFGNSGVGRIFKLTPAGVLTTLHAF